MIAHSTILTPITPSSAKAKTPNWLEDGAIAQWSIQEEAGFFLDDGPNMWDVAHVVMNKRTHDFLSGSFHRQGSASFGTGAYPDARIVSEMSAAIIIRSEGVVSAGGIFCYATAAATDALWGIGISSGLQPAFFDKRYGAVVTPNSIFSTTHGMASIVIATRSQTGVTKIYLEGALVRTTLPVAAPAILGTEVIAIGGRNFFDHAAIWDKELSLAEVKKITRKIKPWLDL